MLCPLNKEALRYAVARNAEPFMGEVGAYAKQQAPDTTGLTEELVMEDEYGRVWSREFFATRAAIMAGPAQAQMGRLANHGYLSVPFRRVPRIRVTSADQLIAVSRRVVAMAKEAYPDRTVLLRGQTREHTVTREPAERVRLFGSDDIIEPSLQPSSTRRGELDDTAAAVWALLVQEHMASRGTYQGVQDASEEDPPWEHASRSGGQMNMALAQHYGLPTPALDVTRDLGVALWFALHRIEGEEGNVMTARPASGSDGVIYVIAGVAQQHFDDSFTGDHALRPRRQHGGFLASNWGNSKNRAAQYLAAAIYFPHDVLFALASKLPSAARLFPGPDEDPFCAFVQGVTSRAQPSQAIAAISSHIYWIQPPSRHTSPSPARA